MNSQTFRERTAQPWGFEAVTREAVETYGDSRNFFVNPNHVQATDLGNTGENPGVPLATVAAAVALCRAYSGDTIYIASNDGWQYGSATQLPIRESLVIPATKPGIKLVGVGTGGLGVYWNPAANLGTCITVRALDVVIENICFTAGTFAGADGIYAEWDGINLFADNLVVNNCQFDNTIDTAIQLEYVWFAKITNCLFAACDAFGIYVDPAGSGAADNIITGNYFQDCDVAMALNGCDRNFIDGNRIYNTSAQGGAAATNEGIDTTNGIGNTVSNNYFSCLLPVPGNGDWDDLNTAAATDAWVANYCLNGMAVSNPT